MQIITRKTVLLIACAAILHTTGTTKLNAQGTWTAVTATAPHTSGGGMILLSDGTVLCKTFSGGSDGYGNTYDKLTPNSSGSYVGGTWSSIAPMASTRLYYSSQVLKDGRVYVAGGEYGTGGALGETYNPLTNTWTSAPAPGATLSDANSEILEDGRVIQALVSGSLTGTKIYNPVTNTYINGPSTLGIHNESAWVKLPDNSVLFVNRLSTTTERYIPASNTWIADANMPVQIYDSFGDEAGGALLLPDGRAFFIGSSGHNAFYTPSGSTAPGTWAAAADFPNASGAPDAPAAMMVNGKILCNASPVPTSANHFPSPTTFYEFDYTTNTFTAIAAPGGGSTLAISTYITNMIDLPNGQVLYSRQNSNQYYVYTPVGSPLAAGKPTISTITSTGANTYSITGTLFNGISQGATYGDDWQMSSNYPIVRLVNGSNVYYARTFNWNSTGVRRGSAADTATFTIPSGLPNVPYSLYVVANGIASDPFSFSLTPTAFVSIAITSGANPSCTGASITFTATPTNGGTTPVYQWQVNGSNVGTNSTTYTTTSLISGQIVTCVMTSNLSGVLGNPATSSGITMTVNAPSPAVVSIAASATTICSGTSVTFTATPTNGGTAPSYQWKINGVNAGTNSATFATATLSNGQVVSCVMTSNSTCVTTTTATSNSITITVNSNAAPSVTIAASSNPVCTGNQVLFTATPTNAGLQPSYQWKVNGVNVGNNSPSYSTTSLTNGQVVTCVLSSNAMCPVTGTLGSSANTNTTTSDLGAAYPTYYGNGRQQYLILASELTALGLSAGNINSIGFTINGTTGDPASLSGYTIKMATTSVTVLSTTFQTPTFTTVFGPTSYTPVLSSLNTHTLSTPFAWNGTSNIVVDICFSNQVVGNAAYQSLQTSTSFVSTSYYQADGSGGSGACSQAAATAAGSVRPNMVFSDAAATTATSNSVTMTINPLPTVTASNVSGCSGSSIALSGTPAGGTWSVANPYSGSTTTYTHTYTDANGCTNTSAAATITVNPLPSVTASNVSGCSGSSIALSGAPAGGTWSVANPYSGSSTTYTHTYTDANGCTNTSAAATITVNPLPSVTASNVSGCSGSSIALSGAPAGGTWSVANPYIGPSTTYTHTYTDADGCTNTSSSATITVNPLPTVTANNVSGCAGNPIALSGTPGGGTWSVANPYSGSSSTYTHTYIDGNGCTNTSASANITVNPLPTVTANNVSGCAGTSIALSGTPAGGTWSVANPYSGSSTTYTHTYTDGNGCTNTSASASITVNSLPTVTADDVSGCSGSSITLSGTPAGGTWSVTNPYSGPNTTYTHTYTDANGCTNTSAPANITMNPLPTVTASDVSGCTGTSIVLSGTPAGGTWSVANPYSGISTTYTHTYTDANGCTNTSAPANITMNPLPTVTASDVSGCIGTSIALSGTPAGGTWSVSNPYSGSGTTYIHTYTDGNGCTNTSAAATITVNPLPTVTANNVSGCTGSSIALLGTPSGGTWSVTNPYLGSSTTYTHTYTDANGCTNVSAAANITVNPLPTVSFSGLAASYSVSASAATLTGSPVGGTFSGPGISGNTFTPSAAGAGGPYTITYSYTDGNGCSNSSSQQTTVTSCAVTAMPGTITTIGGTAKMCPGDTKSYKINAVSGAGSYTWTPPTGGSITSGQGTIQVTINYTAAYTVTGTLSVVANNACGSSAARTLTITRNNPVTPGVISGLAYGVCNSTGVPYSIVNVAGMTFNWSFNVNDASVVSGQNTNAITADYNSPYISGVLSVTANNACGTSTARSLTVRATPETPASITGATSVCANQFGVPYSISPITTATSYTWTGMNGSHISDGVTTSVGKVLTTTSTSVTVNFGSTSGTLSVKANNTCGAGSNKTISIFFTCRDNISDGDFNLIALPNPASTELNVFFNSENSSTCTILLNDILGKTQLQLNSVSEAGENNYHLELGKLAKGMYFLEVMNGEKKNVLRIVVQ